ncbi:hypothetical protein H4219_001047 [Mycoemilia scoparia]|uniref:Uncharacterized protein n=1 Tax=Mycoemilia scoparia TaxID=417184 RepID=A0A9W8AAG6_9FUNG|nr:hypothetical protein H4219_001047 [Mycoemilia scoparia]
MKLISSLFATLACTAIFANAQQQQTETTVLFVDNNGPNPVMGNVDVCNRDTLVITSTIDETVYFTPTGLSTGVTVDVTSFSPIVSPTVITVPLIPIQPTDQTTTVVIV